MEAPPPQVDDEIRRREEEELQRVLEMSMHDKGGRSQWEAYAGLSSSGAGGSSSAAGVSSSAGPSRTNTSPPNNTSTQRKQSYGYPAPSASGYVPARSPSPTPIHSQPVSAVSMPSAVVAAHSPVQQARSPDPQVPTVTSRVRALHTFEPTEPGELAFEKGDIIKVVDRNYKDWWRGQLKGRTGIFPVNYVVRVQC